MNSEEIGHLLDECRTVEENCLYTGQAHFEMANASQRKSRMLTLLPSILAVITGALSAILAVGWLAAIASAAAGIAGLASLLGVDKEAVTHKAAGNLMTSLRHDARALHECYWKEMTRVQLYIEVRRLNDRYRIARLTLEPTDNAVFEKARERIKRGLFEPDFRKKKIQNSDN